MAEATQKKKSSVPAAQSSASDVLETLAQAGDSITRVSEDAKARKIEKNKEMKRSESEARAQREQDRAARAAQQKQSDLLAEQKLAAFHYAENYRKKLVKDKEKMASATKEREEKAREEAEALARTRREAEIAMLREKEQAEAKARSERASALLNRVTKCAVVGDDGNVRMVDRAELARIEAERAAERAKEEAARAEAERIANEQAQIAAEAEDAIKESAKTVAYPDKDELVSAIVSAFRQSSPLFVEYENRAREEIAAKRVEEFFVGEMMDTRDGKFVLNIVEDDFTVAITDREDELIVPPVMPEIPVVENTQVEEIPEEAEENVEETEEESSAPKREYPPVRVSNPVVLELREMASNVAGGFDLWKYLRRVKKVTKQMHVSLDGLGMANRPTNADITPLPSSIMQEVMMLVDLLNIRCDALSLCVELEEKKKAAYQAEMLFVEIGSYNDAVEMFRDVTGEELTRISSFLPEYLLSATGMAVIPAYEFRERYVELLLNSPKKKSDPYTFVFPSLKEMANGKPVVATPVDPDAQSTENRVTTMAIINASVSAASVYSEEVVDKASYKKNVRAGNKIVKMIDKSIKAADEQMVKLGEDQNIASDLINLEKEKILVAFHRLANSMKTGKVSLTMLAKSYVLSAIREYNGYAKKYAKVIGIDLASFDTSLPEYIIQTGKVPEIPRFAYCIELFETVGNTTRLVGEREVNEQKDGYTFVFGDYNAAPAPVKPEPSDELKPVMQGGEPQDEEKPKKGKKKYMAAEDSDTVYLTIPFGEEVKSSGTKRDKHGRTVYTPDDVPVTLYSSGDAPITVGGAKIEIVTESNPAPAAKQPKAQRVAPQVQQAPQAQPVMLTQETVDTLARALSDAVKIAEYAKVVEQYAQTAERAAKIAQGLSPDANSAYNNTYAATSIPQPLVSETAVESNYERIKNMPKNQLKAFVANAEKCVSNARRDYAKADAIRNASRPDAKPRMTVECLAHSKAIIDNLSDILAAYSNTMNTDGIRKIKQELIPEIHNYNRIVLEYERLTGGKLTSCAISLPDDIVAGRYYQSLPRVKFVGTDADAVANNAARLAITESSIPSPEKDIRILNREQLRAYLSRRNHEIMQHRRDFAEAQRKIAPARNQKRAIAVLEALIAEREIINGLCECLVAACQVSSFSDSNKIKRQIGTEVKTYNALVKELESISGDRLTPASDEVAQEIISGMSYQPLPTISYNIVNSSVETVDKISEAIAKGEELYKDEIAKAGHVALGTVAAKIAAQANKDVGVISHCAAFEVSLLESERDILRYGFGGEIPKIGRQRKEVARKIAKIKKNHKKAIKCAEEDNNRYYQVVTNNPATVETKKPNPNRKKLAALRTRMIALLNERDKINSKLTAIYTGEEYNLDGTGVNQTWRRVKADAIEKEVKRNKYVALEIKHLPASDGEKGRLYDMLNKRLDAVSTIALCKYRMKNEHIEEREWNRLARDRKEAKKLIRKIDVEMRIDVKRIWKRYKESGIASAWLTGMGFFLLFALLCIIGYIMLFNMDIVDSIKFVKGLLGI